MAFTLTLRFTVPTAIGVIWGPQWKNPACSLWWSPQLGISSFKKMQPLHLIILCWMCLILPLPIILVLYKIHSCMSGFEHSTKKPWAVQAPHQQVVYTHLFLWKIQKHKSTKYSEGTSCRDRPVTETTNTLITMRSCSFKRTSYNYR